MSNAAVEMSRRNGDSTVHAFVLFMRFRTLIGTDRSDERFALARELLELPGPAGSADAQVARASRYWQRPYALLCEAVAALEQGERDRFEASVGELESLALAPDSLLACLGVMLRGTSLLMDGRLGEADANLTSISARLTDDARLVASYYAQLICIRSQQGRIAELLPMLVAAADVAAGDPVVLTVLAFAQVASGQPDDAARTMASARGDGFPPDPAQHRLDLRHGDRRGDLRGAPAAGVVPRTVRFARAARWTAPGRRLGGGLFGRRRPVPGHARQRLR